MSQNIAFSRVQRECKEIITNKEVCLFFRNIYADVFSLKINTFHVITKYEGMEGT